MSNQSGACPRRALRYTHGGIGAGSAHRPIFASRASCSSLSSSVSPGAYFRYHQHQPSLTRVWLTWVPSSRNTSARVRPYLSRRCVWSVTLLRKARSEATCLAVVSYTTHWSSQVYHVSSKTLVTAISQAAPKGMRASTFSTDTSGECSVSI